MKIFFSIAFIFSFAYLSAQPLTKEYVENWILLCDSTIDLSLEMTSYIIEGLPFDNNSVKEELAKYDLKDPFLTIDYILKKELSKPLSHTYSSSTTIYVIVTNGEKKLNKKDRKEALETIKAKFSDDYSIKTNHIKVNANDPVLVINNRQIRPQEANSVLSAISPNSILNFTLSKHSPYSIYGQNAKNGLVKIWTKSGKLE